MNTFVVKNLMNYLLNGFLFFFIAAQTNAQQAAKPDTALAPTFRNTATRKWVAGGISGVGMTGTLIFLERSSDYHYHQSFRTVNDARSWRQMDKGEHIFLSYTSSRLSAAMWQWAGYTPQKAVWISSATSLAYLTVKEYLDGHNINWGWSWTDMMANISGVSLFAAQELGWKEQRMLVKYSAWPKKYDASLKSRTDELFGNNMLKQLVKDHNAQTYWLSGNIQSLLQLPGCPAWLNIAVGIGAENMLGAFDNIGYDKNGNISFDRTDLQRYRQWYIAPDIDLTRIKTKNKTLKTVFTILNSVKIPAPALEFSQQKLKAHWLHF